MDDRLATLVPQPRSVRALAGTLELGSLPPVVRVGNGAAIAATAAVSRVLASIPWPRSAGGASQAVPVEIGVHVDAALGLEAFRLRIEPTGVTIAAGGEAGAFYAAQTLRQLLPDDAWRAAPPLAPRTPAPLPATGAPLSATGAPLSATGAPAPATGARLPATAACAAVASGWQLPAADIEDEPALSWRGAHIDVARNFFTKRELLALTDALAALRINRLHLHLTDDQGWRVESHRFPALHEIGSHRLRTQISLNTEQPRVYEDIPQGGFYTLADLAELAGFAADRMMTLVPEVDLPGHSAALLAALPQLGVGDPPPDGYQVSPDWGILPYLISPLPDAQVVIRDVLAEIVTATAARYVHIGGDECVLDSWRADPRITAYQRERGLADAADLHAAFLRDIADTLADDLGVRAVVWDEGFTSTAGGRGPGLRADTIVMTWRGMAIARAAADAGHDVVADPVFPTYFDYYQENGAPEPVGIGGPTRIEDVAAFAPLPADWPRDARERVLGTQFQVWTEYIRDSRALEYMIFPRACALAEVAWTGAPAVWTEKGPQGQPPLRDRVAAHLGRLAAAGLEYRPLSGPLPWQQGGTGPRRFRAGYAVQDVAAYLDQLAAGEQT